MATVGVGQTTVVGALTVTGVTGGVWGAFGTMAPYLSVCAMVCPVPEDQRPLNEYLALKESWFYGWAGLPAIAYYRNLLLWGSSLALLAAPVAAASFAPRRHSLAFALVDLLAAALGIVLVWGRLWLGWNYVRQRLAAPVVPYEETGWYDGQAWEKPLVDRTREALLVTSEVVPRLQRIQRTWLGAIALVGVCGILLALS